MSLRSILRVEWPGINAENSQVVWEFKDVDRAEVGPDGQLVYVPGERISQWGYRPNYARRRRRFLQWCRWLPIPRRWIW